MPRIADRFHPEDLVYCPALGTEIYILERPTKPTHHVSLDGINIMSDGKIDTSFGRQQVIWDVNEDNKRALEILTKKSFQDISEITYFNIDYHSKIVQRLVNGERYVPCIVDNTSIQNCLDAQEKSYQNIILITTYLKEKRINGNFFFKDDNGTCYKYAIPVDLTTGKFKKEISDD